MVVENFRPDVKNRLGVDYESLAAVNPRIILASISGFGQTGPYAKRPGFDQIAQGMGGLMSITGAPGAGPMRVGIPVADLTSGHFTAQGILIALLEREKSGKGQWVHSSLLQAQIAMLDFQASRWLMAEEIAPQTGNEHPTTVPTNLYPCSDGAVNVAVSGDVIWRRLCDALGKSEWADDPDYVNAAQRKTNRDALNAAISEVTKTMTMAEIVETLLANGVPTGPAYKINEVFADEQVQHLGMAADIDTLPFGRTQMVAQPISMSRTNTSMAAHPPDRGEHSDEILTEIGYDPDKITDLRSRNVV